MKRPGDHPDLSSGGRLLILAPLAIEGWALRGGAAAGSAVVRIGMGPKAASRAGRGITSPAADATRGVAVAGFCGGLRPDIACGDVVVASEVQGPDGTVRLPSAPAVAKALRDAGITVHVGPLACVERMAFGSRRARASEGGALAVDMESYWLLQRHARRGERSNGSTPVAPPNVCVVRAVSDTTGKKLLGGMLPGGWLAGYRSLGRVAAALDTWAAALGPRDVLLATPRSFCGGVNGAIRLTEEALALNGAPVYVLHEIVHNRHVVDSFRERGVVFVPDVEAVPEGEMVVFSAHGVGQAEREQAAGRRLRVVDATCPLVGRVHAKAKSFVERGHHVVLIGKKGHDEVKGVEGEAPGAIHVVEDVDDIEQLDLDGGRDIAILTQTTLVPHQAQDLIAAIEQKFPGKVIPPAVDVCYASQERQEAVRSLAPRCDLMLVIGSKNSSNSKRLVEEAARVGTRARLVDDESEVNLAWLVGVRTLGLTAGASAPESLLERMVAFVASLGPVTVSKGAAVASEGVAVSGAASGPA